MNDITLELRIKTDPDRVFEAIVDPVTLSAWFAEQVDISIEKNRYDFWGRYTPENPDRKTGAHKIIAYDQGRLLAFEWNLRGRDTRVEYEINSTDEGSLLRLKHTGLPQLQPYESSIGDFWTHILEGLRSLLELNKPYELMDYSRIPYGEASLTVGIMARPQDVFQGLIDPNQLDRWIAKKAEVDPKPGGKFSFGWEGGPVKILEIDPDRKLSYSWRWEKEPETVTTWELGESGGTTRLTVVQSGFAPDRNCEDYYIGWHKYIHRLKAMLEGADWKRVRVIDSDA
jgi:uncharacterized protein YndB with AHSA1/START domain